MTYAKNQNNSMQGFVMIHNFISLNLDSLHARLNNHYKTELQKRIKDKQHTGSYLERSNKIS